VLLPGIVELLIAQHLQRKPVRLAAQEREETSNSTL
jgi:hypothetical protein